MSDLIERKKAIDVCNKAIDLWQGQLGEGIVIAVRKKIEELPSAQPAPCEDAVSREAAIDVAENAFVRGLLASPDIRRLPSAQPETAKRIVGKSRNGMTLWYQCDMCNEPVDAQDNFCRGCGRRLTDG